MELRYLKASAAILVKRSLKLTASEGGRCPVEALLSSVSGGW
jgi:hypothetical protein